MTNGKLLCVLLALVPVGWAAGWLFVELLRWLLVIAGAAAGVLLVAYAQGAAD